MKKGNQEFKCAGDSPSSEDSRSLLESWQFDRLVCLRLPSEATKWVAFSTLGGVFWVQENLFGEYLYLRVGVLKQREDVYSQSRQCSVILERRHSPSVITAFAVDLRL